MRARCHQKCIIIIKQVHYPSVLCFYGLEHKKNNLKGHIQMELKMAGVFQKERAVSQ